jgi:hypothetical protein
LGLGPIYSAKPGGQIEAAYMPLLSVHLSVPVSGSTSVTLRRAPENTEKQSFLRELETKDPWNLTEGLCPALPRDS